MTNHKLSPKKYIQTKARNLPFHECYISEGWGEKGLATVFVSKKMPSGKLLFGVYLVDIFCLGVKNSFYNFNLSEPEYEEVFDKITQNEDFEACDLEMAHNLIYGAIDFAEELGFQPHSDFNITQYILDEDLITDGIDEIEFGKDGKPFFINGPSDNVQKVIATLNKTVGEGNYEFLNEI
jgi:hypothetical protein